MAAADLYQEMVEFARMTDILRQSSEQLAADARAAEARLAAMPPMATDIRLSFGGFEDYTKKPAPLDDMFSHMKTGGTWIVKVGTVMFYVVSIDALNKTAVLVRLDSTGNKVTNLKNAAIAIGGILQISAYGA